MDDFIENVPEAAVTYGQYFFPPMLLYLTDPDTHVRQASVYGAGAIAQFGREAVNPIMPEVVNRLRTVIEAPESRRKPYIIPGENAISALGKVAQFQGPPAINPSEVMTMYLNYLPLREDRLEGKDVYERLCVMLEEQNPVLLGENFCNLPRIITIFGEVLGTDFLEEEQHNRMLALLRTIQASLPAELLQSVWGQLDNRTRGRIHSLAQQ